AAHRAAPPTHRSPAVPRPRHDARSRATAAGQAEPIAAHRFAPGRAPAPGGALAIAGWQDDTTRASAAATTGAYPAESCRLHRRLPVVSRWDANRERHARIAGHGEPGRDADSVRCQRG